MTDLRTRRLAVGLTQRELAELAGCTANYIAMLERGEREASRTLGKLIEMVLAERESQPGADRPSPAGC